MEPSGASFVTMTGQVLLTQRQELHTGSVASQILNSAGVDRSLDGIDTQDFWRRRPDVTVLQPSTGVLPTRNFKISPNCVDFDRCGLRSCLWSTVRLPVAFERQ